MSARRLGAATALALANLYVVPAAATDCEPALHAAAGEGAPVLTLAEAASFLQMREEALAAGADRGEVPARRLAGEWRFSRAALVLWLAGADKPADCLAPETAVVVPVLKPPSAPLGGRALATADLAVARGAGTSGRAGTSVAQAPAEPPPATRAPAPAPSEQPAPGQFGEDPDLGTARDVALREQVLLPAGQGRLEASFFYTRSDEGGVTQVPLSLGPTGIPFFVSVEEERESQTLVTGLSATYAMIDDLEAFVDLDHVRSRQEREAGGQSDSVSRQDIGDIGVGARYGLLGEGPRRPRTIVSLQGTIPTDSEAFGLGGGLSLVKTLDPATLFGSLSYLHTFNGDSQASDELRAEDTLGAVLGFAFALNDRLSYSTALQGAYSPSSQFGDDELQSSESYSLRFALTSLLTEQLSLEPSVAFSLNEGSAVTLGLSIPYRFSF